MTKIQYPNEIVLMKKLVVEKDKECKCDCAGPFEVKEGSVFKQSDYAYNFYQFFDYFHGEDKKPHEFLVRFDSVEDIERGDEWSA